MSKSRKGFVQVVNQNTGQVLIDSARWCKSSLCKFIGFQFRKRLRSGESLILVHRRDSITGSAIHMFFVFTSLGVIWVDSSNTITHLQAARPWRPHYASPVPACYVIETGIENLNRFHTGDSIEFRPIQGK